MALYTIADLHLAGGTGDKKNMDVFDPRWTDARNKLEKNWRSLITEEDKVIIPGDISWALKLEDTAEDFDFINSLPGQKYIGKGNHDFWWTTAKAMTKFFNEKGYNSLNILYNNSFVFDECAVVCSRGWFPDPANQKTAGEVDWDKISSREEIRFKISIDSLPKNLDENTEKIAFLHFPPVWNGFVCRGLINLMHQAGIRRCFFGHIHGYYMPDADFDFEDIHFQMISADRLNFTPQRIFFDKNDK